MNRPSEIYKITFNQVENNYNLIFKEIDKDNFCEVKIKSYDAKNIALSKENITSSRLKSYDLIVNILDVLSIKIDKVIIEKKKDKLISKIILLNKDDQMIVDANFIDSIIIALKSFSIILISEKIYSSKNSFVYSNVHKININKNETLTNVSLLKRLKKTLIELVDNEQYEHAAFIRDRIKELSEIKKIN